MKLKAGDVIAYTFANRECEAIVSRVYRGTVHCRAARVADRPWSRPVGEGPLSREIQNIRLHPEADRVWADWCVFLLTGLTSE